MTVDFDGPVTYRLHFGDDPGSPATILTFFPWAMAPRGSPYVGQVTGNFIEHHTVRLIILGEFEGCGSLANVGGHLVV